MDVVRRMGFQKTPDWRSVVLKYVEVVKESLRYWVSKVVESKLLRGIAVKVGPAGGTNYSSGP